MFDRKEALGGGIMVESRKDLLKGTLDMLVLKTLSLGPMHGLGISRRILQITDGVFEVKPGSLFPALQRMEQEGWIVGTWGESENNRRAKYYRLTAAGTSRLGEEQRGWNDLVAAIGRVLEAT
jgi:transcriptional regulator